MHVVLTDGEVADVRLRIYEPPRFFEAFLRGRAFTEPPDITARICGICPVAYQMSSCQAIEQTCGAVIDAPLRALRRLLYCGEWIESHVLHIYFLHAPDFLGVGSALELAKDHRELVEKALKLKKIGNDLMEVVGGRAIHPINVRVGGFYRAPTKRELLPFVERLRWARDAALETLRARVDLRLPRPRDRPRAGRAPPSRRVRDHRGPDRLRRRPGHRGVRSSSSTSPRSTSPIRPRCTGG